MYTKLEVNMKMIKKMDQCKWEKLENIFWKDKNLIIYLLVNNIKI